MNEVENQNLFGQKLVNDNLISEVQLKEALEYQKEIGGRLGSILVKLGMMSESQLAIRIAEAANTTLVTPDDVTVDHDGLKLIPKELMEHRAFFPIRSENPGELLLAMADPLDLGIIDRIAFDTGLTVSVVAMALSDTQKVIRRLFSAKASSGKSALSAQDQEWARILSSASSREVLEALIEALRAKGIVSYEDIISKLDEEIDGS